MSFDDNLVLPMIFGDQDLYPNNSIITDKDKYKIISLDPKIYYVESVPVYIEFYHIIGLNIIVLLLCIISIFAPSLLVSKVNPKDSIKFN